MTVERNRELIGRFDDVVATGDVDALDELCTQDMVNHALTPDRPKGLEGTREFLRNAMPQVQNDGWTDSVTVAEGDYVVQFGVRAGIWRGGAFLGFDADPGPYSRHVAFCYRIQDGKIAERWAMRDDLTMLRQLGAFTPQRLIPGLRHDRDLSGLRNLHPARRHPAGLIAQAAVARVSPKCAVLGEHIFAEQNDVARALPARTDRHRGARTDRAPRAGGDVTANESVGAASRSISGTMR